MTDAEKYTELRDRVLTMDKRFGHFAALHRPDDEGSPTVLLAELSHLVHQAAYWCREHPPTPTCK